MSAPPSLSEANADIVGGPLDPIGRSARRRPASASSFRSGSGVDLQAPADEVADVLALEVDDLELPVALDVLVLQLGHQVVDGPQVGAVGAHEVVGVAAAAG